MSNRRKILHRISACLCGCLLSLVCVETWLHFSGHSSIEDKARHDHTALHTPDPVLGWKSKPGVLTTPGFSSDGNEIRYTFHSDSARATSVSNPHSHHQLVTIGGSFTQGWAVSDEDSFPWQLQQQLTETNILNLGTGGYGTYQALLSLQAALDRGETPHTVVYGFIGPHQERNVATAWWLQTLARNSRDGKVALPYCQLNNQGKLITFPPQSYPSWPLSNQLASIRLLQDSYVHFTTRERQSQKVSVTEQLLVEINQVARQAGAKLVVAIMWASPATLQHYLNFCKQQEITALDCHLDLTEEYIVAGEGHPNRAAHHIWAVSIARGLIQRELVLQGLEVSTP